MKSLLSLFAFLLLSQPLIAQSLELTEAELIYKSNIEIKVFYQKNEWKNLIVNLQEELNKENPRDSAIPLPDNLKIDLIIMDQATYLQKTKAPEWVNPFYYEGKIYLRIADTGYNLVSLAKSLQHEIIHAVINYWAGKNAPFWFDEGLAKWHEGSLSTYDLVNFESNYRKHGYTALQELDRSFATMPKNKALAAYTQGAVSIDYIYNTFGEGILKSILKNLKNEKNFEKVLLQTTGLNYQALDERIKKYIRDQFAIK